MDRTRDFLVRLRKAQQASMRASAQSSDPPPGWWMVMAGRPSERGESGSEPGVGETSSAAGALETVRMIPWEGPLAFAEGGRAG